MSEVFLVLDDREHALLRPAMYIGSVTDETASDFILGEYREFRRPPGLVKIINEVLDNSIDEAIRTGFKFGNRIDVTMDATRVTISDNGRGIPLDEITGVDGTKMLRPQAAWTQAKAGTNFGSDRTTLGMNGVGSALTNFYSSEFTGVTCNGKQKFTINCIDNGNVKNTLLEDVKELPGTTVSFIPDFSRFEGVTEFTDDIRNVILDRITSLQVAYPEIKFSFGGSRIRQNNINSYAELYGSDVVVYGDQKVSFFVGTSDDGFRQRSYVNGLQTTNGGTHIDYVIDMMAAELIPMIKRKHKVDVSRALINGNITLVLFIRDLNNPNFDGQTKERLTNTRAEIREVFEKVDFTKFCRIVLESESIIGPIVDALVARQLANERREANRKARELQRKNVEGHIRAFGKPGSGKKMLCLAEGLSAIGSLLDARDPEWIGGLPLRGVVMNTYGLRPIEVMKNKELCNIMAVMGLVIGEPAKNLEYDRIAIMVDADVDGGKIAALLINFFYGHWPELFEEERIAILRTPVIIFEKGKQQKWFYPGEDPSSYMGRAGWTYRYIKGLASLTLEEFTKALNEPFLDVIKIDDESLLDLVFGPDADKRKEWLMA